MFKKLLMTSVLLLMLFGLTLQSHAIEFISPDQSSGSSTLSAEKIINDNFATAGNSVEINGEVKKDLFIAGNMLNVNGKVGNNLFAGGNIVTINNNITGDIFAGASTIQINKNVIADGNFVAVGGNAIINGEIKGKIYFAGGTLEVNSIVDGDIIANVGNLVVGKDAVVKGKITYTSQNDAKINSSAQVLGSIEKKNIPANHVSNSAKNLATKTLLSIIMALVLGVIYISIFPKFSQEIAQKIRTKFWASMGWGFLVLVGTPIAIILCFAVIVGTPVALILISAYALAIYSTKIFVGLSLGKWLTKEKWSATWAMTLGVVILGFLGLIPFLNGITNFIILLAGLGAISVTLYQLTKIKKN